MWVECILSICEGVLMVECILPIFEGVLPGNPSSKLSNGFDSWPKSKLSNGFDSWPLRSLNSATDSILGHGSLNSATASILVGSKSATVHCFSFLRGKTQQRLRFLASRPESATVHC
ncbi:unnamed protein product [Rodentolepis nana]|uniref:Secreted protein n=1 Tax=Rodentolepis nana TaxID=102285 RepID=A0A0R3T7R0_RODNA|nr:unnamed protein product [Rodentolepis nana]